MGNLTIKVTMVLGRDPKETFVKPCMDSMDAVTDHAKMKLNQQAAHAKQVAKNRIDYEKFWASEVVKIDKQAAAAASKIEREKNADYRAGQRELARMRKELRDRAAREEKEAANAEARAATEALRRRIREQREALAAERVIVREGRRILREAKRQDAALDREVRALFTRGDIEGERSRIRDARYQDRLKNPPPPRGGDGEKRRFVSRTISNVAGLGRAAFGLGMRGVQTAAAGFGLDLDVGGAMHRGLELESSAVALSNQAYMPGRSGVAGTRQDPRVLERESRNVAAATALDPNSVMAGLTKFVAKTGDLETGRSVMMDMAKLSKATNAEFHDMIDAAADVSNELGEMDDKGTVIRDVMRGVAAQGKLGAVEIRDLARQMAKVAAAAGQFAGDRAGNILTLGAFAQEARALGGAASASQAATSTLAFTAQFSKPARVAAMKKMGVDPHDMFGNIRDPGQVLLELLQKSKGDVRKMQPAIYDQQAQRVSRGFAQIFRTAYQGTTGTEEQKLAAGTLAYTQELDRLKLATMKDIEINESFARAMATSASKAQLFNNEMEKLGKDIREKMNEPMDALKPHLLGITKTFGDIIAFGLKLAGISTTKTAEAATYKTVEEGISQGRALIGALESEAGKGNATTYDVRTGQWVGGGEYNVEHVNQAKQKAVELRQTLAEARDTLRKTEADAPKGPLLDSSGKPLEYVDHEMSGQGGQKFMRRQKLYGGYESQEDQARGYEIDRQRKSVEALESVVLGLEGSVGYLKDMKDGNMLRVVIAEDRSRNQPQRPVAEAPSVGTTASATIDGVDHKE